MGFEAGSRSGKEKWVLWLLILVDHEGIKQEE